MKNTLREHGDAPNAMTKQFFDAQTLQKVIREDRSGEAWLRRFKEFLSTKKLPAINSPEMQVFMKATLDATDDTFDRVLYNAILGKMGEFNEELRETGNQQKADLVEIVFHVFYEQDKMRVFR